MRRPKAFVRSLLATAITSLTVLGATALTATAGSAGTTVDVYWNCDGSAYVEVYIQSSTADTYDIVVDGTPVSTDVAAGSHELDPLPSGWTQITVSIHGGITIYDQSVPLACDEPLATAVVTCSGGVGTLEVFIADGNLFEFDVFVDDLGTPVADGGGLTVGKSNTLSLDVAPLAEGVHSVVIDGYDEFLDQDFSFEKSVTVSCVVATTALVTTTAVDDSGALGQAFGNNPAPFAAVAVLLIAGGITLVRTGRRRPA
ncbi:MAG: hypothetical protein Q7V57_19085 [Actinomycetota bacterium]|nr:hypothetical protein [Actinomycetota bacterium]